MLVVTAGHGSTYWSVGPGIPAAGIIMFITNLEME
jgi:hypothetical protein